MTDRKILRNLHSGILLERNEGPITVSANGNTGMPIRKTSGKKLSIIARLAQERHFAVRLLYRDLSNNASLGGFWVVDTRVDTVPISWVDALITIPTSHYRLQVYNFSADTMEMEHLIVRELR